MLSLKMIGGNKISARISALTIALASPRRALDETGDLIIEEIDNQFKTEGSHFGTKWQALTKKTLEQKVRMGYGGKGILERTGKLRNSFVKDVKTFVVHVKSTSPYYEYHQVGTQFLPKRPMIKDAKSLKSKVMGAMKDFIRHALTKFV